MTEDLEHAGEADVGAAQAAAADAVDLDVTAAESDAQAEVPAPTDRSGPRRPAGVPEKFWDPQAGTLRTEALLKSYLELERKLGSMIQLPSDEEDVEGHERLRRAMGVPETSDDYVIKSPDDTLRADPEVNAKLHEAGFTQRQAQLVYDLAAQYVVPMIDEAIAEVQAGRDAERLAAHFGGEASWRTYARQIKTWGRANLPQDVLEVLSSSYDGIIARPAPVVIEKRQVEEAPPGAEHRLDHALRPVVVAPARALERGRQIGARVARLDRGRAQRALAEVILDLPFGARIEHHLRHRDGSEAERARRADRRLFAKQRRVSDREQIEESLVHLQSEVGAVEMGLDALRHGIERLGERTVIEPTDLAAGNQAEPLRPERCQLGQQACGKRLHRVQRGTVEEALRRIASGREFLAKSRTSLRQSVGVAVAPETFPAPTPFLGLLVTRPDGVQRKLLHEDAPSGTRSAERQRDHFEDSATVDE
jgi:hypothetical protein